MTDLMAITALGVDHAKADDIGPYTLRENTGLALASLACADSLKPFGLTLPAPGKMSQPPAGTTGIWIGQSQWMIAADGKANTDFAADLLASLGGQTAYVTDQTDGWVAFDITAPDAPSLERAFEYLVNLPKSATAIGCAARTFVHHMSVIVSRPNDQQMTVLGLRSYAESLHHILRKALQTQRL